MSELTSGLVFMGTLFVAGAILVGCIKKNDAQKAADKKLQEKFLALSNAQDKVADWQMNHPGQALPEYLRKDWHAAEREYEKALQESEQ